MRLRCWSRPVLVLSALALLAGCATDRARPPALDAHRQATALYQDGQYDRAAELWLQAASMQGPNASYWRLLAASALIHQGSVTQAEQLLQKLDAATLTTEERALRALLRSDLLLRAGRANQARQRLPDRQELPPAWRADFDRLAGRIGQPTADPAEKAVNELAAALDSGTENEIRARFREAAALPTEPLQQLATSASDSRTRSLALLAKIARKALLEPRQRDAYITAWRMVDTPALDPFRARRLIDDFAAHWDYPQRVAVLLPESGRLRDVATALRNGLVTAWLQLPATARPRLLMIDSGASASAAAQAYLQAVEDNADWILGPLDRDAVETVVSMPGRTAPVLALNQRHAVAEPPATRRSGSSEANGSDGGRDKGSIERSRLPPAAEAGKQEPAPSDAFFFALPAEQEARASARQALEDRCQRALLLASDDTQGRQLAQAFDQHFAHGSGRIVTRRLFSAETAEYEELIGEALHVDRSRGRKQALQSLLGVPIAFEPQPRDDLDCVLLAATAQQARSIMPQFNFLGVSALPVYATQRVYSGRPDPRADRDLNGLRLPVSPWLAGSGPVRPSLEQTRRWFGGLDNRVLAELFGLGLDTMRLLPYLYLMRGDEILRTPGASGNLGIGKDGTLLRELTPARFEAGRLTMESS